MKPKTKRHHRIISISKALPALEAEVKPWAFEKVIKHIAYRTKTKTSCLSCGHTWKGNSTVLKEQCPSCNRKLHIENSRKMKLSQLIYFAVLDVREEFQINRYFQIRSYHKAGEVPRLFFQEIVQQFMSLDGKHEVVALNHGGNGYYQSDNFHGNLEIRDRSCIYNKYNVYPDAIYPKYKVLPVYKRNGFMGNVGVSSPLAIFNNIVDDSKAETLLKTKQYELLGLRVSGYKGSRRYNAVEKYWNSIKICIRNKYIVRDAITWVDYLELLEYFKKDVNNSKYVCPKNLTHAHNILVGKKRKIDERIQAERERIRREQDERRKQRLEENKINPQSADQLQYIEEKSQYFGLEFTQGNLKIKVLESVQEFYQESKYLQHCVFTNEYFKKKDTLVFSAQIEGVRIETIEVQIDNLEILQSRGFNNLATEHNERILRLMRRNLSAIEARRKVHQIAAA